MENDGTPWWGLKVDYDRLFGAVESGWLRPRAGDGFTLGDGAYRLDEKPPDGKRPKRVAVHLKFDPALLPPAETAVMDESGVWRMAGNPAKAARGRAVRWTGPLPMWGVSGIGAAGAEDIHWLDSMSKNTSTVELGDLRIHAEPDPRVDAHPITPPDPGPAGIELGLHPHRDRIQGAAVMAMRAAPGSRTWLGYICSLLSGNPDRLREYALSARMPWLSIPPWATGEAFPEGAGSDTALWGSAVEHYALPERTMGSAELARSIAERAAELACTSAADAKATKENRDRIKRWRDRAVRIVRAETTLRDELGIRSAVEIAVAVSLVRPRPEETAAWAAENGRGDYAAIIAAAALSGGRYGFSGVPGRFRGRPEERRKLALFAVRRECLRTGSSAPWAEEGRDGPWIWRDDMKQPLATYNGSWKVLWGRNDKVAVVENGRSELVDIVRRPPHGRSVV